MEIAFFWLAFAVIVGVAANTRGRNPIGWFLLSVIISPLLAGLLVLALPRQEIDRFDGGKIIITRSKDDAPQ